MFLEEQTTAKRQTKSDKPSTDSRKLQTYLETPIFPNVLVRDISGLMQARSFRCWGCLIQSSQYDFGHLLHNSNHKFLVIIQPKPGKKSVLYNNSGFFSLTRFTFPLSFQAEMHHKLGSFSSKGWSPRKYSKKSGEISKSSAMQKQAVITVFKQWIVYTFHDYNAFEIEVKKRLI